MARLGMRRVLQRVPYEGLFIGAILINPEAP